MITNYTPDVLLVKTEYDCEVGSDLVVCAEKLYSRQTAAIINIKYKMLGTGFWNEVLYGGGKILFADEIGETHLFGRLDMEKVIRVNDEWIELK